MFFILGVLVLTLGSLPLIHAVKQSKEMEKSGRRKRIRRGAYYLLGTIVFMVLFNVLCYFYSELLWFQNLTYEDRFWKVFGYKLMLFFAGGVVAYAFLFSNFKYLLSKMEVSVRKGIIELLVLGFSLIFALWATGLWEEALLYFNQAETSLADPIFNEPVNFYLFGLPLISSVLTWFFFLIIVTFGICGLSLYFSFQTNQGGVSAEVKKERIGKTGKLFLFQAAAFLLLLAWNSYLNLFRLLYSDWGVVQGAGFVDVHFRTLGYYVSIAVYAIFGVLLLATLFSDKLKKKVFRLKEDPATGKVKLSRTSLLYPGAGFALIILLTWIVPGVVAPLAVKPNEITLEKPYIENNIKFTRKAYNIDDEKIEQRQYSMGMNITPGVIRANEQTLDNVRLWDWRALMDNLQEQQEIRLYYKFHDVDVDRYHLNGDYRQVMLSVRELEKDNLDIRSDTWVSRHFKYTHGYGLVLVPAHEFLPQGKPKMLIKNIPPEEDLKSIEIKRPQVYYGEKTRDHVYVNTSQQEFDYPMGDKNMYTRYKGKGGVNIGGFLEKLVYAWKFDGYRIFFSAYFTENSRVLFYRHIKERVNRIAPFLRLDKDPYAVISDEGRIKYIIDAYTLSSDYPYSKKYDGVLNQFWGYNYIRNSVKIVVDAYDGTVDFYIVDPDDLLIRTYQNIFPGLFKTMEEMPQNIRDHIRYPEDYLTVQADVYSTYHMTDPEVFYQKEDVWQFATERYRENFQRVIPYYVMVHFPREEKVEFVLINPFTPKNKNVINAWMAGRCDYPNYGKLMVYQFPKGVEVLGPRQIEARIDQDTEMSQSMTLWGQRGSEVIRGNLLTIPLFHENTLYILYAEPIYLQAESTKMPEIKRIVLADQEKVVWAEEFPDAVRRLVGIGGVGQKEEKVPLIMSENLRRLIQQANQAFQSYQQSVSKGEFRQAGKNLEDLRSMLKKLEERPKP
jgi:uncharacterized membrane protein (UPF0182 family)